ncbi:hypothetical protein ACIRBX_00435 [Kitasatospora sp. NPDC096147]|uniref:hypothetical protein n=1 Tax=Kitasatospora sp. NPDC096147 TaxID=3364093 RepID=UPI00380E1DC2
MAYHRTAPAAAVRAPDTAEGGATGQSVVDNGHALRLMRTFTLAERADVLLTDTLFGTAPIAPERAVSFTVEAVEARKSLERPDRPPVGEHDRDFGGALLAGHERG